MTWTDPTATDNCTNVTVTCVPASGSTFAKGMTTVTCTAVDGSSNTNACTFTVTINDTEAPTLTCPGPVTVQCDSGIPAVNTGSVTAADNCGATPTVTHVSDVTNGSCPKIITRTYRATDDSGNTNDCAQVITIHDTTPPMVICSASVVALTTSTNGTNVTFASPSVTDNCGGSTSVACVPSSGSFFPVGSTAVLCSASDLCGNSNTCSFTVTVNYCQSFVRSVNAPVPDGSALGLASTMNVASPIGALSDVNVTLNLNNGWNGDLFAYLVHDSGYAVLLNRVGKRMTDPLGYDDAGFNVTLDDQAAEDVHSYRIPLTGSHLIPLGGPLSGSWKPDGRATDPSLVVDGDPRTELLSSFNGLNPNGEWVLFVEDDATGDTSFLVDWSLQLCGTLGVSPAITNQPQSQNIGCGSNVTFTVGSTGTQPIGYQWYRNAAVIPGATGASLTLTAVLPAAAASYTVLASNAFGAILSAPAALTIFESVAVIASQPQSRTNNVGTTANFSVLVVSCGPVSYQWFFGATPLLDQTNATLSLANVQLADAGGYSVTIANSAGSVGSAVAVLTVNRVPDAQPNGAATIEDVALVMSAAKLLANDSDPDGDPLAVVSVTAMSTNGGSVTLMGGSVTYTPQMGFTGVDRLTYTISDGRGGSASADVEIFVVSGGLPSLNQVSIVSTPGGILIRFAGVPAKAYRLQRSTTVSGPWSTVTTLLAPLHGIMEYLDSNPPMPSAFYRTVSP